MGSITVTALESVTGIVEIVLPGPQGPVGDIHPSMPGLVQQATDAATSATASALSADTSEANASASAAAALASKDAAAVSEGNALASANAASGSATVASTKAGEASASATSAAASATAAATSATDTANALVGERSAVATLTNKTITSPVIDSGAANGVAYLNGSKVLTSGGALTFDGSTLATSTPSSTIANFFSTSANGGEVGIGSGTYKVIVGANFSTGVTYFGSATNSPVAFLHNGAEQMRLTSTGLGIGTSSPLSRLSVNQGADGFDQGITVSRTGANRGTIFLNSADDTLNFGRSTSTHMSLNSSGNLGLGVVPSAWSSLSALHVKGTAHFAGFSSGAEGAFVTSNAYFNGTNWIYQTGAAASYFRQSGGAHQWFTAPSEAAGTAISFTQAMDLVNSAGASTLTVNSAINTASAVRLTTTGGVTAGMFLAVPTSDHSLGFQTGGSERLRIDTNGNLLVGKTAQSSGGKLEVAGNVVCQPSPAAPTLAVNGEMSFQLVSDTSLKILVRGSDGITRSTTLTLT